jgi:predicted ATPase
MAEPADSPADPSANATSGSDAHSAPPTAARWQVRLLGAVRVTGAGRQIDHFPSRAVAALLARLALAPDRTHAREELVELLWPGVAPDVGRNRLRQVLSTLKSLLEPAGGPGHTVLQADRLGVRVVPGSLACDGVDFERLARAGQATQARALYQGELMPGYYDEWIEVERLRLAELHQRLDKVPRAPVGSVASVPTLPTVPPVASAALPGPLPAPSPPWPDVAQATLPHYLTRVFGAEAQALVLRAAVLQHRLVTLVGPGGSGKTRLAVELAHALASAGAAGFDLVAFVPLVACNDDAQMLDALLAAFHGRAGGGDAFERLLQMLAGRSALIVLDNFEQLPSAAALRVARLAAELPGLHQVLTSRRALGLDGEQVFAVNALSLPVPDADLDAAASNPAVALFVDRARAARADFHLHRGNLQAVVALVRALEGMPLAIELAAARVRSFAPAQMLARLGAAGSGPATAVLDLLSRAGPRAGHDPRHASMQAVIAWSWQQLSPPQAQLLSGLTVFTGGCTADAADAVCGQSGHDTDLLIAELHAQSMLRLHDAEPGPARITLAEPVREYAAVQLPPASATRLRARHRAWWPRWAAGFGPTPPLGAVRGELPNLVAALASAVADGAPDDAVHLALSLRPAFSEIALPASGLVHLAAALERVTDPALASRGHTLLGLLCFEGGEGGAAQQHTQRGLALAGGDPALRARALHADASVRWRATRDPRGLLQQLDEADALAERAGDAVVRASIDALRAFITNIAERDYARGEALHRQALARWQQLGNLHVINGGLYNLAICDFNAGRFTQALQRVAGVCTTAREHEDWEQLSDALNLQGNTLAALRRWPEARDAYRDCLRLAWATMETHALAYGLWNLPTALAHLRQPESAVRLMSFAAHYWQRHFGALAASDQPHLRRVRRLAQVQVSAVRHDALWAEGAALPLAEAVALALAPEPGEVTRIAQR